LGTQQPRGSLGARTGGSQVDRQHGELADLGCGYHEFVIFPTRKRLL
jgi:hypothetical protein